MARYARAERGPHGRDCVCWREKSCGSDRDVSTGGPGAGARIGAERSGGAELEAKPCFSAGEGARRSLRSITPRHTTNEYSSHRNHHSEREDSFLMQDRAVLYGGRRSRDRSEERRVGKEC